MTQKFRRGKDIYRETKIDPHVQANERQYIAINDKIQVICNFLK